jgi:dTDP-4-dehydrorhamnose 3,5-epimerase
MIFTETKLNGAYVIEIKKLEDVRGFFSRVWCKNELEAYGLISDIAQINTSYSKKRGTLRGMHYQVEPNKENKIIRCTKGAIYDVIIDLRPKSPTYKKWLGIELTAENYKMLYVPEDFAHGFQTLEDDTEVVYQVSQFYSPQSEQGVRYNDSAFGIRWPIDVRVITDKDKNWADYTA